jgi:hypothetical protein
MTIPIRPADPLEELARRIVMLEQKVYAQNRGLTSGRHSLGIDALRPGTKAGIPSDADYTAATMPAIGTIVLNSASGAAYMRISVGLWKSWTPA